jgi:hypothetical protein
MFFAVTGYLLQVGVKKLFAIPWNDSLQGTIPCSFRRFFVLCDLTYCSGASSCSHLWGHVKIYPRVLFIKIITDYIRKQLAQQKRLGSFCTCYCMMDSDRYLLLEASGGIIPAAAQSSK